MQTNSTRLNWRIGTTSSGQPAILSDRGLVATFEAGAQSAREEDAASMAELLKWSAHSVGAIEALENFARQADKMSARGSALESGDYADLLRFRNLARAAIAKAV